MIVESAAITSLKAVEAAGQSSAAAPAAAPSMPTAPAPAQATEQFRAMMDAAKTSPAGNTAGMQHSRGQAEFGHAVASQDHEMQDIQAEVDKLQANSATMSPQEYTAASIKLQFRMTQMMTTEQLGMGFAQGGKGAVQNLMKNS